MSAHHSARPEGTQAMSGLTEYSEASYSEAAPEQTAADPVPDRQQLVARARELFDEIRGSAQEAELERHLPDSWVAAYSDAGLLRTLVPRRFGGS